ncbi:ATP-binding protein [Pleomorphovibrio marinus]|uniref:ATP-binding protein n=1 Tax=Pleomorphovibrio marinus TaxID=2164132 RepID=UPI0018E54F12|nr:tetratricopeptide repeat protein [Pleomorphovibrio marinus]
MESVDKSRLSREYADVLNALATSSYNRYPDSTFIYGQRALEISEAIGYEEGVADAFYNIGGYYNKMGNYSNALLHLNRGLQTADQSNYQFGKARILHSMGLNFFDQGLYDDAVEHYLDALKIKEDEGFQAEIPSTLNNLGLVFTEMEAYDRALQYLERALAIRGELEDKTGLASTYSNIALVKKNLGELEEALDYYTESLQLGREVNDKQMISVSHYNIGDIQIQKGEFDRAIENFEEAWSVDEEMGDMVGISYDLLGLGEAYFRKENYQEALKKTQKALEIAENSGIKTNIAKGHSLLSDIFEKLENGLTALYHHRQYKAYSDSIYSLESESVAKELATKYEFDKLRDSLVQQQREQELEREKEWAKITRNSVILLSLFLLLALFIAIRSTRKQRKARNLVTQQKAELEKLNREITLQKEEIEKIAKDLDETNKTKDKLFSIVSHDLRSPINSLKGLMQYSLDENLSQEEFNLVTHKLKHEVEQVHFTLINLLHWAKGQMKGITAHPEPITINPVISEIIELYQSQADAKNVLLQNEVTQSICCMVDKDQLNLILRNLVHNALKFTPDGGKITVSASKKADSYWEITVEDSGIGMDQPELNNLFKMNVSNKKYGTAGEKGTGLGLLLVRDFVVSNQGEIRAQSQLGKGSKFTLSLPARP